jgi:hypothetical protein
MSHLLRPVTDDSISQVSPRSFVAFPIRKRTRSQGPSLRRHYPASTLLRPCPTPARACRLSRHSESRPATRTGLTRSPATPLPACRAHYPGGSERVRLSVASPSRAAFPVSQPGRHPHLHYRGLLRLHSRYGPLARSTAQGGLRRRASVRPVARANRLPATSSTDNSLRGYFLHWFPTRSGRTEKSGLGVAPIRTRLQPKPASGPQQAAWCPLPCAAEFQLCGGELRSGFA